MKEGSLAVMWNLELYTDNSPRWGGSNSPNNGGNNSLNDGGNTCNTASKDKEMAQECGRDMLEY